MAVKLEHGALAAGNVPHEDAGVVAAGEEPALLPVPGERLDAPVVALEDVDEGDAALLQPQDGDLTGVIADEGVLGFLVILDSGAHRLADVAAQPDQ